MENAMIGFIADVVTLELTAVAWGGVLLVDALLVVRRGIVRMHKHNAFSGFV